MNTLRAIPVTDRATGQSFPYVSFTASDDEARAYAALTFSPAAYSLDGAGEPVNSNVNSQPKPKPGPSGTDQTELF